MTIPGAILRRPVLVAVLAIAGLAAGVAASRMGSTSYESVAKIIVQDPRTGSETQSITLSPERYVTEQVAVFDLDTLAESAAEIATTELRDEALDSSATTVEVAAQPVITVGLDRSVTLGTSRSVQVASDGGITFSVPDAPTIDPDGNVVAADGSAVTDRAGEPLSVQATDTLVARADGLMVVVRPGGELIVVEPPGFVAARPVSSEEDEADEAAYRVRDDGTIVVPFGERSVEMAVDSRPTLLDADGAPLGIPQRSGAVGIEQQLILLREDGAALAQSESESVVVTSEGEVVVLDREGQVVARSDDIATRMTGDAVAPTTELTAADIRGGLTVTARPQTNLIELKFGGQTPQVARIGANAVVEAYQQLQRSDSASANAAAVARADEAINALTQELVAVERDLTNARLANPVRADLERQQEAILVQLAEAGDDLLAGSDSTAAQRIRDLLTQLDALERVEETELSSPELAELDSRRQSLVERIDQVQAQRDSLLIDAERGANNVALSSPATGAYAVGGLGPTRLGFVGLVLGFLVGAGVAYVLELRRPTIQTAESVSQLLGAPMLGEIPDFRYERISSDLPVVDVPNAYVTEAFHITAAAVAVALPGDEGTSVGLVSAGVGDGKTTVSLNLAAALALTQRRVLAVDADLEGQVMAMSLWRHAKIAPGSSGLVDVLARGVALEDASQRISLSERVDRNGQARTGRGEAKGSGHDDSPRSGDAAPSGANGAADGHAVERATLDLLAGGEGAAQLRMILDSEETAELFSTAKDAYDVTVVDSPPLLSVAYTAHLLRELDWVVVVVPSGAPTRNIVELRDRLRYLDVRTLGFVFNRGPLRPERTASVPATFQDRGGVPTRRQWGKRRAEQIRAGGTRIAETVAVTTKRLRRTPDA